MSDQRGQSAAPIEPYFDRTPRLFGDGLQEPLVYDASPRMLRRQRLTVAVSNETDHPIDLLALNHLIATAIAAWA